MTSDNNWTLGDLAEQFPFEIMCTHGRMLGWSCLPCKATRVARRAAELYIRTTRMRYNTWLNVQKARVLLNEHKRLVDNLVNGAHNAPLSSPSTTKEPLP